MDNPSQDEMHGDPEPYKLTDSSAVLFKDFLAHYNGRVKGADRRPINDMEHRCDGAMHWARFNGRKRNASIADVANELNRMCADNRDNSRHVFAVLNFALDRLPSKFVEETIGLLEPFQAHSLYMRWHEKVSSEVLKLVEVRRGTCWDVPKKLRCRLMGLPYLDETADDRCKKKGGA